MCRRTRHEIQAPALRVPRPPPDSWFDSSGFPDTADVFVPIFSPITEPAVGYAAVDALVFIGRKPAAEGRGLVRPYKVVLGGDPGTGQSGPR
jgi:hypothetical protein